MSTGHQINVALAAGRSHKAVYGYLRHCLRLKAVILFDENIVSQVW